MGKRRKKSTLVVEKNAQNAEKYHALLDEVGFQRLIASISQPVVPGVRVNSLKCDPIPAMRLWSERYGWDSHPLPFCPHGWSISRALVPPGTTEEYTNGYYFILDVSSMLPAELFDSSLSLQPLILDLSASPGGKTTHLIDRWGDKGFILANDVSYKRVVLLSKMLRSWGAMNTITTQFHGEKFGDWFPDTFDLALVDAPCSMENLSVESGQRDLKREISPRERKALVKRQIALLSSALRAIRVGGQVVYSTCTLSPLEDECVLQAVLEKFAGQVEILPVPFLQASFSAPPLISWEGKNFDDQVQNALRVWPFITNAHGFFCALLRKVAPSGEEKRVEYPMRDLFDMGWDVLTPYASRECAQRVMDELGIGLDEILETYLVEPWQRGEDIFLIPARYHNRFTGLPFFSWGLPLLRRSGNRAQIAREFVTRFKR